MQMAINSLYSYTNKICSPVLPLSVTHMLLPAVAAPEPGVAMLQCSWDMEKTRTLFTTCSSKMLCTDSQVCWDTETFKCSPAPFQFSLLSRALDIAQDPLHPVSRCVLSQAIRTPENFSLLGLNERLYTFTYFYSLLLKTEKTRCTQIQKRRGEMSCHSMAFASFPSKDN